MKGLLASIMMLLIWCSVSLVFGSADISIDGEFADWESVEKHACAEGDTFGGPEDATMDILEYRIANDDTFLYVTVIVNEDISKGTTSRGAYQAVIDVDNDYDTGIQTDTEAPYPPHENPMGVDRYVSVETDTGVYQGVGMAGFAEDAKEIGGPGEFEKPDAACDAAITGNQYELCGDMENLGIEMESHIRIAILNYSAAGTVDWTMPAIVYHVTLQELTKAISISGKSAVTWGWAKNNYK